MHFLDQSPLTGYVHENTRNYYEQLKDDDYLGYLKSNGDNTYSVQYKPRKEFTKDNLYKNTFLVRQVKFDDIDFNTKVKDDNFAGHTYPTIKGTKMFMITLLVKVLYLSLSIKEKLDINILQDLVMRLRKKVRI